MLTAFLAVSSVHTGPLCCCAHGPAPTATPPAGLLFKPTAPQMICAGLLCLLHSWTCSYSHTTGWPTHPALQRQSSDKLIAVLLCLLTQDRCVCCAHGPAPTTAPPAGIHAQRSEGRAGMVRSGGQVHDQDHKEPACHRGPHQHPGEILCL